MLESKKLLKRKYTEEQVECVNDKLKNCNVPGMDDMTVKMLQYGGK